VAGIGEEYRTVSETAGWLDRTDFGRLAFTGADVLSFLQGLLTNDVASLRPGSGVYAAYLTPNGRMIADFELHVRAGSVVAEVAPGTAGVLAEALDALIFSEDVQVRDVTTATCEIAIVGLHASLRVADALGLSRAALDALAEPNQIEWANGFVSRGGDARLPMFKVFADTATRDELLARFGEGLTGPLSQRIADTLRVEAGRPRFGVDLGADTIPLEAGLLERAISTSKGCYVGQEIVIRMLHRGGGRVAKHYVTLTIDSPDSIVTGAPLLVDGREVGRLTTIAPAPEGPGSLGIGHVGRDHAEVGTRLDIGPGGEAVVSGLTR
jgi:tRNA-modifying protein YgfZ